MKFNNDFFTVLRKLHKDPSASQRRIAEELNLSLGKINYCIKALKNKGLVKVKNFKDSTDKSRYLYVLTPKGISEKTRITINFMKIKMKEYDDLKKDLSNR